MEPNLLENTAGNPLAMAEQTLKELQAALAEIDAQRHAKDLDQQERELLELSAVGLRDAERLLIASTEKEIIAEFTQRTEALKELSKTIRARVTKMNRFPKVLDTIEDVLKEVIRILTAIGKW